MLNLKMVGEGSYANVFSYVDPDYGIKFAVKRAKRGIGERDLLRFRQEFEVMKRLSFPYVVEVHLYDEDRNEYQMDGLRQADVANHLGCSRAYYARVEAGTATIHTDDRQRLAALFKISTDELERVIGGAITVGTLVRRQATG